jgi:hypothetical protein
MNFTFFSDNFFISKVNAETETQRENSVIVFRLQIHVSHLPMNGGFSIENSTRGEHLESHGGAHEFSKELS